jgi:hypothetical protein
LYIFAPNYFAVVAIAIVKEANMSLDKSRNRDLKLAIGTSDNGIG